MEGMRKIDVKKRQVYNLFHVDNLVEMKKKPA